ncbi:MAG: hypothetical protein KC418_06995 [Anaerolineales bacterium]|nr:hypothetical protein [Anaerolineales bacterium]MCB8951852.1 hypothetical protein [Ardenticatenales bacterium]
MIEPELITVLEGPTPEFQLTPQLWSHSIYEGPEAAQVAFCELRTASGEDIKRRCLQAWHEGRPVKLDFPDEIRMRQQIDVVAMRLRQVEEGTVLMLWVTQPFLESEEDAFEEEEGDDDDTYSY